MYARARLSNSKPSKPKLLSGAIAVIAPTATVKSSMVGLLFARKVEGNVKAMFGPRAAVAFGAAFGTAFGVAFALARGLRRGRRR